MAAELTITIAQAEADLMAVQNMHEQLVARKNRLYREYEEAREAVLGSCFAVAAAEVVLDAARRKAAEEAREPRKVALQCQ